jgi:class 3 adenylate cyclase
MILIPEHDGRSIEAFAMLVDINGFYGMVNRNNDNLIANFTRDVLHGAIKSVESAAGEVVGFMGDAIYALLPDVDSTFTCCVSIAKDIDDQCEYISGAQSDSPDAFPYAPGGPSVKVSIEYGALSISTISSRALGLQRLFIGPSVNYAARIARAGTGNRCLFGPIAYKKGLKGYQHDGPHQIEGKTGEGIHTYYELELGDVWRTGDSDETYWG